MTSKKTPCEGPRGEIVGGYAKTPVIEGRDGAVGSGEHLNHVPPTSASTKKETMAAPRIYFSSPQDPRSWDPYAEDVGMVITCISNGDARKAEKLFNDLLARCQHFEREVESLQRRLESNHLEYVDARNALTMAGAMTPESTLADGIARLVAIANAN